MKKKEVMNHVNGVVAKLKSLRENKINDDQKAIIDEVIKVIEDEANRLNEVEEDVDNEELFKKVLEKVDEKFQAYLEKDATEEEQVNMKAQNYLKSANATHEFLQIVKNSQTKEKFASAWAKKLSENGVTGDLQLPDGIHTAIQDAWERKSNWLNQLNNTGAKKIIAGLNTSAQDIESSRAKCHTPGNAKVENNLVLDTIDINAKAVYSLIKISNESEWKDDGTLLNYITKALFDMWKREICRAILVGDGRVGKDHISSVVAVDRERTDNFVQVATHDPNAKYTDEIISMIDFINNEEGEDILLFMKKETFSEVRRFVLSQGGDPQYITKQTIEEMLGVSEIILTNVIGANVDIIAMMPKHYTTVGGLEPVMASQEDIVNNEQIYRFENFFGGAPDTYHFGAVLKSAEVA